MPSIPIITGPTAVGKTACSLDLAEELDAEILSADSRQIYKELTIGTAKPTPQERSRVPHHFIDELHVGQAFSAGMYAEQAYDRIRSIRTRGRVPLVVGGSTLYVHALQFGLADIPRVDPSVRRHLEDRLRDEGAEALYEELTSVDPAAAERLDPTKTQRLVRALEVYHGTGRALSSYYEEQEPPPFDFQTVVLHRDRKRLYERINTRVDAMLEQGLLDEVRGLLEAGFDPSDNPLRTIGYQEPIRYLRNQISYEEMVRLIKRNTRRYAKRQLTWFRRYEQYVWIDVEEAPVRERLVDSFGVDS